MKDEMITGLWVNVARAYEIALAGNYTIKLLYNKTEYPSAPKDFELIKRFYPDVKFNVDGDISVEIYKPYIDDKNYGESIAQIVGRVRNISNTTVNEFKREGSVNLLLKTAQDRLNLGVADIKKIKEISFVIARLEKSELIDLHHVAEAIHYFTAIEEDLEVLGLDNRVVILDKLLNSEDIFNRWAQNKLSSKETVRLLDLEN